MKEFFLLFFLLNCNAMLLRHDCNIVLETDPASPAVRASELLAERVVEMTGANLRWSIAARHDENSLCSVRLRILLPNSALPAECGAAVQQMPNHSEAVALCTATDERSVFLMAAAPHMLFFAVGKLLTLAEFEYATVGH